MNLHDELERLADGAPVAPQPDRLLHRARAVKTRRAIAVPTVAVLAVLVIVLPGWTWITSTDPAGQGAPVTLTFRVRSSTDPQLLERTRRSLEERAKVLGLGNPRASIQDDHTIVLDTTEPRDAVTLAALTAPGRFQLRRVAKELGLGGGQQIPSLASTPTPTGPPATTLDGVIAKLGNAYQLALDVKFASWADYAEMQAFRWLTPQEVALLPPIVQFNAPSVSCEQLNARPGALDLPPDAQVVVCDDADLKLLLEPATLTGADLADATPGRHYEDSYPVSLWPTRAGSPKWTAMLHEMFSDYNCVLTPGVHAQCSVAMLVDGRVHTEARILEEAVGLPDLIGRTKETQRALAAQLGPLELPVELQLIR